MTRHRPGRRHAPATTPPNPTFASTADVIPELVDAEPSITVEFDAADFAETTDETATTNPFPDSVPPEPRGLTEWEKIQAIRVRPTFTDVLYPSVPHPQLPASERARRRRSTRAERARLAARTARTAPAAPKTDRYLPIPPSAEIDITPLPTAKPRRRKKADV